VDAVFRGTLGDMVKLVDVNQYTETGMQLIDRGSKTFATTNPTGEMWGLCEGYSLNAKDIDLDGNKVWSSLSKNDVVVEAAIVDNDEDRWFKYYNAGGLLIFSASVDAIYRGTESNLIQLKYVSQYSEIDGSVLIMFGEYDKKNIIRWNRDHCASINHHPHRWTDIRGRRYDNIQCISIRRYRTLHLHMV
ncbi:MAG: S-layer protein, partial [Candidatus Methanomarinus sp.]